MTEGPWPVMPLETYADRWHILRCAPVDTLRMAAALRKKDCLAWAPAVQVRRRIPRTRVVEVTVQSLLPSFVFVAVDDADRVSHLIERGQVPQAKFFLFNAERPWVSTAALWPMEMAQRQGFAKADPLAPGDRVHIHNESFGHMGAHVLGSKGRGAYEVAIEGMLHSVIFPGFLLQKI